MSLLWRMKNQVNHVGVRPGLEGDQILLDFETSINKTLYTVPALSTLLVTDWCLGTYFEDDCSWRIQVRNGANVVQATIAIVTSSSQSLGGSVHGSTFYPIELPTGWDIRVFEEGTGWAYGYVHGILIPSSYV